MNLSIVDFLWCLYQLFFVLSFWRHPFTAEDPLVSKWYNDLAEIVTMNLYLFFMEK